LSVISIQQAITKLSGGRHWSRTAPKTTSDWSSTSVIYQRMTNKNTSNLGAPAKNICHLQQPITVTSR